MCGFLKTPELVFGPEVEVEPNHSERTDDADDPRQCEQSCKSQDVLLENETENKSQHWRGPPNCLSNRRDEWSYLDGSKRFHGFRRDLPQCEENYPGNDAVPEPIREPPKSRCLPRLEPIVGQGSMNRTLSNNIKDLILEAIVQDCYLNGRISGNTIRAPED